MYKLVDKCNCDVFAIKKDKNENVIDEHLIGNYDYYEIARDVAGTELYKIRNNESDYSYVEIRRYSGEKESSEYTSISLNLDDVGDFNPWISREEEYEYIKKLYEYNSYDLNDYLEDVKKYTYPCVDFIWSREEARCYYFYEAVSPVFTCAINASNTFSHKVRNCSYYYTFLAEESEWTDEFLDNNIQFYNRHKDLITKLYEYCSIEVSEARVLFDLKHFNLEVRRGDSGNIYLEYCDTFEPGRFVIDIHGNCYYSLDDNFPVDCLRTYYYPGLINR